MSNSELANLALAHRSGSINSTVIETTRFQSNENMIKKFDEVTNAIQSQPVYLGRDYNATERAIIDTVITKGRIERNHKKVGGIW